MNDSVEHTGKLTTRHAPLPDLSELNSRRASEPGKVLVSDGIPPVVQLLEFPPQRPGSGIVGLHFEPELDAKAVEIFLKVIEIRIPVVQPPPPEQIVPDDRLQVGRRSQTDQILHAFGMKVPAEALKVRREQHDVSLIDLLGRVPSAPACDTDRSMGMLDLVQSIFLDCSPALIGFRWHIVRTPRKLIIGPLIIAWLTLRRSIRSSHRQQDQTIDRFVHQLKRICDPGRQSSRLAEVEELTSKEFVVKKLSVFSFSVLLEMRYDRKPNAKGQAVAPGHRASRFHFFQRTRWAMKLSLRSEDGGICRIQNEGEISLSTMPRDPHLIEGVVGPDCYKRKIVFDLQHTPYIDSSGVSWLVSFHKRCREAGGILVLHSIPPSIMSILRLLHMDRYLNLVEDEQAAQVMAVGGGKR
jgi:anti-sigma B factor antagonist